MFITRRMRCNEGMARRLSRIFGISMETDGSFSLATVSPRTAQTSEKLVRFELVLFMW